MYIVYFEDDAIISINTSVLDSALSVYVQSSLFIIFLFPVSAKLTNMKVVTYIAPVNIAVIKYCEYECPKLKRRKLFKSFILGGKRNEELILPLNDSISGSLSTDFVSICRYSMTKIKQIITDILEQMFEYIIKFFLPMND